MLWQSWLKFTINNTSFQMFGKVGSLQTKSWKLREESGDLPVELLCNKCQYFSSDLHSTRASHIMLLELIIDRWDIDLLQMSRQWKDVTYYDDPENVPLRYSGVSPLFTSSLTYYTVKHLILSYFNGTTHLYHTSTRIGGLDWTALLIILLLYWGGGDYGFNFNISLTPTILQAGPDDPVLHLFYRQVGG